MSKTKLLEGLEVVAGTKYRNGTRGVTLPVKQIIVHGSFNNLNKDNDIAILVLDGGLPLNNKTIQAIKLAENGPTDDATGKATGWGLLHSNSENSNVLQAVHLQVVSNKVCKTQLERIRRTITDSMFCAGGSRETICAGDTGGPFVVHEELVGVISWSKACGSNAFPNVYSKVSYLRPWILKKVAELNPSRKNG